MFNLPATVKANTHHGRIRKDETYKVLSSGRDFYVISVGGRAVNAAKSLFYTEVQLANQRFREQQQKEYDRQLTRDRVSRAADRTTRSFSAVA